MNIFLKILPLLLDTIKALTTKNGYKSRTVVFGALLVLMAGLQTMMPELTAMLGKYGPYVSGAVGIIVVMLRTVTSQPLSSNATPPVDTTTTNDDEQK